MVVYCILSCIIMACVSSIMTALDAPSNFKTVGRSETSLSFSWQSPYHSHHIECSRKDNREINIRKVDKNILRASVFGLAVYTNYSCRVKAVTTETGAWSPAINLRTSKGGSCVQSLGMENGVIPDSRLSSSKPSSGDMNVSYTRLNSPSSWCSINAFVQVDLGRIMTVTGLELQSNYTGVVNIKYGIKDPSDLVDLWEEKPPNKKREFEFSGDGYTRRHWFENNAFTVRYLRLYSATLTKICLKFELYGCAETCSPMIKPLFEPKVNGTKSIVPPNIYSSSSWCSSSKEFIRYDFGMKVTLTGVLIQTAGVNMDRGFKIRFGNSIMSLNYVKKGSLDKIFLGSTSVDSVTTHWFDDPLICSISDIIPESNANCMRIEFTGCLTECMHKLGVEKNKTGITMSASGFYESNPKYNADKARLNDIRQAWSRDNKQKELDIWIQVCFSESKYISSVAVQGQGYVWNGRINKYFIKHGNTKNSSHDYKINNAATNFTANTNRYSTNTAIFPMMLKAKCIRLHKMQCSDGCSGRLEIMGCDKDILPKAVITQMNDTLQCAVFGIQPMIKWKVDGNHLKSGTNYTIKENKNDNVDELHISTLTFQVSIELYLLRFGECGNKKSKTFECFKKFTCVYMYMYESGFQPVETTPFNLSKSYQAPRNFSIFSVNITSITFSWNFENNKKISKLRMKCCRRNCRETIVIDDIASNKTMATVDGLAPFTLYKCKIQSFTYSNLIEGIWSNEVNATTAVGGPCMQPLGMESGLISDTQITSSPPDSGFKPTDARLNSGSSWCASEGIIWLKIDLGRIMTVTGMALQGGSKAIHKVWLKYGVFNISNVEVVKMDGKKADPRTYDYPRSTYTKRYWFMNTELTLRYIEFHFMGDQQACLQIELYGCAEICSSAIQPVHHDVMRIPSFAANCTKNSSFIPYDFGKIVTLTGLWIKNNNFSDYKVRHGLSIKKMSFLQTESNVEKVFKYIKDMPASVHWFDKQITCRFVDVIPLNANKCVVVQFLGCSNGCMDKLGIEAVKNVSLRASSVYGDGPADKAGNGPRKSFLNNLKGDWTKSIKKDNFTPWIEACFNSPKLINAVAIQGQGYWNDDRVFAYYISYTYGENDTIYNLTMSDQVVMFNGPNARYATAVRELPISISATCVRLNPTSWSDSGCSLRWELLGCHKATNPHVELIKSFEMMENTTTSISCNIIAQPGFINEWKIEGGAVTTDYHNVSLTRSSFNANGYYDSQLEIYSNISKYIVNAGIPCTIDDKTMATCYVNYTCSAYYPDDTKNKGQQHVVMTYTGLNARVASPLMNITTTNASATVNISSSKTLNVDFPIVGYLLTLDGLIVGNISGSTLRELSGLSPYTSYTVSVFGVNRLNVSSENLTYTFRTDEGIPTVPHNFTLQPKSKEEITVTWYEPKPPNGKVSKYEIQYRNNNLSVPIIININVSTVLKQMGYIIRNLSNYQKYEIKVRAFTKANMLTGPWTAWQSVSTLEGEPTKPRNVSGVQISSRSFNITWQKPLHENGILKTYFIGAVGTKTYAQDFEDFKETNTIQMFLVFQNLYPGTEYSVHVNASTGAGKGPGSDIYTFKTVYAEPFPPNTSLLTEPMEQHNLSFYSMRQLTGPISEYQLFVVKALGCASHLKHKNVSFSQQDIGEKLIVVIKKGVENVRIHETDVVINLVGTYTFCYRAVVSEKNESTKLYGNFSHQTINRTDLSKLNKDKAETTDTSITIILSKGPTSVKYYQVIVSAKHESSNDPSSLKPFDENSKEPYITAEFSAGKFDDFRNFVIGDGEEYPRVSSKVKRDLTSGSVVYKNVKLKPGTEYSILQRAYDQDGTYYSTPWLSTVKTDGTAPTVSPTASTTEKKSSNTTMIAGISVAVVIVIVVMLALLFVMRSRRNSSTKDRTDHKNLTVLSDGDASSGVVEMGEVNPGADIDEKSSDTILDRTPPKSVELDARYPPVNVTDFPIYWEKLKKDTHHALTEEYQNLNSGQQYRWTDANKPELKQKNRYANIVAYDHSRVHLSKSSPTDSDYINASFIHGYATPNMYIASQGPNQASLNDFWRMIWEQQVPVIVMATRLIERSKKKCEQYWPTSGTKQYGDIEVTLTLTDAFTDVVVRMMSLKKVGSKGKHEVQQYHYMNWPDHGVPTFPSNIINLRHKIRKVFPIEQMSKPMLVHCSAGVGRTGTFICIDSMLHLAKQSNKVDVFNYVNFLRTRRIHMVQTEDQYNFIYHALFEAFTCGTTEMNASDVKNEYRKLLRPNQENTKKTGFELQFERLNILTQNLSEEDCLSGNRIVNKTKNRHSYILPRDENRVMLTHSAYDEDGAEYINAIYVDGYKQKDAFIATNHPLPSTDSDFWSMIYQKKIGTIVMLNTFYEEDESYPLLWPACGESSNYNNTNVKLLSESNDYKVATMKFMLTDNQGDDNAVYCTIFQYLLWPDYEAPSDANSMVNFLNVVEKHQYQHEQNPIVVICSDGAARTGAYIAISIILEQLKLEQVVDVFQTVKKIRSVRPQFVGNEKQFKFCHDVVLAYIDCFSTYSNYTD